jgi:hypothetical protein
MLTVNGTTSTESTRFVHWIAEQEKLVAPDAETWIAWVIVRIERQPLRGLFFWSTDPPGGILGQKPC